MAFAGAKTQVRVSRIASALNTNGCQNPQTPVILKAAAGWTKDLPRCLGLICCLGGPSTWKRRFWPKSLVSAFESENVRDPSAKRSLQDDWLASFSTVVLIFVRMA